ncbi:hypothetical protein IFM89_008834 [Coptis chinensis]|uniref:Uncharacterized protein n=1 Tax=Coptis chinensis TaxID=261450 RepID=A0A835HG89_9MAGN|nr:hypothetical protein IFM89_008834 [Coptis chinensis]
MSAFIQELLALMDVRIPISFDTPYDLKHSCESRKLGCNRLDANATVDDSVMFKLGNALSGILRVQDVHLLATSSEGFNIQHSKRLNVTTTQEKSNYYGPSSCSEEKVSNLVSLDEKDEVPDISLHMKSHTESENLSAECPISLPTFTKPVSAMKGSREKVGIPLKKLSVTWAPDVEQQQQAVLSYPSSARLLYGDYNQTKFGSSFLRTSLAEVHVTVAEAT